MDSSKEIILPSHKEITEGWGKSMMVQELREGSSYFFLGIGERQVVKDVISADLGREGKVSQRGKKELSLRLGRIWMYVGEGTAWAKA